MHVRCTWYPKTTKNHVKVNQFCGVIGTVDLLKTFRFVSTIICVQCNANACVFWITPDHCTIIINRMTQINAQHINPKCVRINVCCISHVTYVNIGRLMVIQRICTKCQFFWFLFTFDSNSISKMWCLPVVQFHLNYNSWMHVTVSELCLMVVLDCRTTMMRMMLMIATTPNPNDFGAVKFERVLTST